MSVDGYIVTKVFVVQLLIFFIFFIFFYFITISYHSNKVIGFVCLFVCLFFVCIFCFMVKFLIVCHQVLRCGTFFNFNQQVLMLSG